MKNFLHHLEYEKTERFQVANFKEGHYRQIEFGGIVKGSNNIKQAQNFIDFMLSEEFQSVIPSTNIMYPVTTIKDLPEAFNKLEIPNFIQIDPKEINKNKEKWIDEWLNAS